MTERIRELTFQAGAKLYSEPPMREVTGVSMSFESVEKFAELIVRECVAICQDTDGEDNFDAKSGRQDCAVEIREHFGVDS